METPQSRTTGLEAKAQQAMQETREMAQEGMDKMEQAATSASSRLSSTAHGAVDKLSGFASQAKATLSDKAAQLKDVQSHVVADTRHRIREKPIAALAIAAAAGFLVRQLFRMGRRHD